MSRSGAELALLLLGGYRTLVDGAIAELAARGHPGVRPVHDFAMRAIAAGADNASALGRRLSVSKQAAAKSIDVLVERGYVERGLDPDDGRRKRVTVTALGREVMREGEGIFDDLRRAWERRLGEREFAEFEDRLALLVGDATVRPESAGWVAHDLDGG